MAPAACAKESKERFKWLRVDGDKRQYHFKFNCITDACKDFGREEEEKSKIILFVVVYTSEALRGLEFLS